MALKTFMREISDTSATTGTGALTMQVPVSNSGGNAQGLGNIAQDGDQVVLCLTDMAGNFEVSQCTVSITGTVCSISRDTVVASSGTSNAKISFASTVTVHNFIPAPLNLVLFNLQYQQASAASLSQMATDISDLKDAMTLMLDGGNP